MSFSKIGNTPFINNLPALFDVPATGHKTSKAKSPAIKINRVNKEIAKKRYYFHRHLGSEFEIDSANRQIKTIYKSYEEIPVGPQRYYLGQLINLGYNVQYELL